MFVEYGLLYAIYVRVPELAEKKVSETGKLLQFLNHWSSVPRGIEIHVNVCWIIALYNAHESSWTTTT